MSIAEIQDRSSSGYSNDWYDVDGDYIWGESYVFEVTVPEKKGDLHFNVESYYVGQVPKACFWLESHGWVFKSFNLFKNKKEIVTYGVMYYMVPINKIV